MFDLKVINSVLAQLEEERGIPRAKIIDAIEIALATAYKREYGKRGQIIRATFDLTTGGVEFFQIKIVVDDTLVRNEEEPENEDDVRSRFNPEHHIMLEDAKRIKKDSELDSEITFPLEMKDDFGRIAAQTAKQVIVQKIREAEKISIMEEYGEREGEIVTGTVQRIERGNMFIDLGRATGIIPYEEQIPGERYRQGERLRAYLYSVEESHRGTFLRLSRSHPDFLKKLFEMEVPELASGSVEIKVIAREAGSRSKLAVVSHDEHIDPVGSLVGQRGVRVATVMGELGGEKIDITEWSEDPKEFIEEALSPAKILNVEINEEEGKAIVEVAEDQQSLAIGKGGQNVRLAAKLTGWRIDIHSLGGESIEKTDETDTISNEEIVEEGKASESDTVAEETKEIVEDKKATKTQEEVPNSETAENEVLSDKETSSEDTKLTKGKEEEQIIK
ncbi:MAG TPA: transcription termination/antitermination protein NusA [Candidatus Kaiserbacteria bacterium]|nr:transcription termination/antitermination protein NusA [Candidatus Kaiserbacteria bacterium]